MMKGYICGFVETDAVGGAELIEHSAAVFVAPTAIEVLRSVGEDRSWDKFTSQQQDTRTVLRTKGAVITTGGAELEHCGYKQPIKDVVGEIRDGTYLRVSLRPQHWQVMDKEIREHIPEAVHGGFIPNSPVVRVGWHDIFEVQEETAGHLFGRAWYSIALVGNGSPNDWKEFRRRIVEVPTVRAAFEAIERVTGPLRRCIYWE
jgi:hypothetical protein